MMLVVKVSVELELCFKKEKRNSKSRWFIDAYGYVQAHQFIAYVVVEEDWYLLSQWSNESDLMISTMNQAAWNSLLQR